jgi:hypothetical protein
LNVLRIIPSAPPRFTLATPRGARLVCQTPPFTQGPAQKVLDLAVEAAQFVACPQLQGLDDLRVDPEKERLPAGHGGYW